jgi:spectrin alpha
MFDCFCFQGLIDSRKCAGLETTVDNRLQQIIEQWEFLVQKSSDKSLKLKEASRQQTFNAGVKDVEFWLGEVRYFISRIPHNS